MPDHDHESIENLVIVVASKVLEKPLDLIWREFGELKKMIEDRDRRLLDDLTERMKPVVGEFKDRAVSESNKNSSDMFKRVFNVSLDDNKEVKDLQDVMRFAEALSNARRVILGVAIICIALVFAVASGHGMNFLKNFGAFFFGGG